MINVCYPQLQFPSLVVIYEKSVLFCKVLGIKFRASAFFCVARHLMSTQYAILLVVSDINSGEIE